MIQYRPIEEVINHSGLRLVLVQGMPSPWGQAAKTIFELKQLDFVVGPQEMGGPNETFGGGTVRVGYSGAQSWTRLVAEACEIDRRHNEELGRRVRQLSDEELGQFVSYLMRTRELGDDEEEDAEAE